MMEMANKIKPLIDFWQTWKSFFYLLILFYLLGMQLYGMTIELYSVLKFPAKTSVCGACHIRYNDYG